MHWQRCVCVCVCPHDHLKTIADVCFLLGSYADSVDGWAVTFGTATKGLGEAPARPGLSSLYQM